MQLNEIFSEKLNWSWASLSHDMAIATFSTSVDYQVVFKNMGDAYFFGFDVANSLNGEMTNEHMGAKIIATVIDIVKNFTEFASPSRLTFYARAEESTRVRLYRKILMRFAKQYRYGIEEQSTTMMGMDLVEFRITL